MSISRKLNKILTLIKEREYFISLCNAPRLRYPPGHFYSPIPSQSDMAVAESRLTGPIPDAIPGIDLNLAGQQALLHDFERYYKELPFPEKKTQGFRYFYENPSYLYSDAIALSSVIRHFRPHRIVEVGSGYSSCCILDTNERFCGGEIDCTFIEPYPELLLSLLKPEDTTRITIHPQRLQEIDLQVFDRLGENDLLVIDSTHVLKSGSDVERIFAEILPHLKPGVLIHFHDIFYPFEYPREWIREGRAWNEIYALRSFLQFNDSFRIVFFNTYLQQLMPDYFAASMPLCLKNTGGSIWLKKLR